MTARLAVGFLVLVTLALPVRGQTSRGDGSQTGDGSTPFTGLVQAPEASMFVGAATTSIPIQVPREQRAVRRRRRQWRGAPGQALAAR